MNVKNDDDLVGAGLVRRWSMEVRSFEEEVLGMERIPSANRIKTKNKHIISIENINVEDDDDGLRDGAPRVYGFPFGCIFGDCVWI